MIWDESVSFKGFLDKKEKWYSKNKGELCDTPIDAQYALDLIFKTLIDDKKNYPYLTTMSESTKQTNSIMLDLILCEYSRKYRKFKKQYIKNKDRGI